MFMKYTKLHTLSFNTSLVNAIKQETNTDLSRQPYCCFVLHPTKKLRFKNLNIYWKSQELL